MQHRVHTVANKFAATCDPAHPATCDPAHHARRCRCATPAAQRRPRPPAAVDLSRSPSTERGSAREQLWAARGGGSAEIASSLINRVASVPRHSVLRVP